MTDSSLGKITGADKKKDTPEQQASVLGAVGDFIVIHPYGLYADLPADQLIQLVENTRAIPITQKRPSDTARGEPVFFHPETNTRIIARNDGSLDIETGEDGSAPVNIKCTKANVKASESVNIDSPSTNLGVGGKKIALDGDPIASGKVVASGINTSI